LMQKRCAGEIAKRRLEIGPRVNQVRFCHDPSFKLALITDGVNGKEQPSRLPWERSDNRRSYWPPASCRVGTRAGGRTGVRQRAWAEPAVGTGWVLCCLITWANIELEAN
jgi:hypothetical protein